MSKFIRLARFFILLVFVAKIAVADEQKVEKPDPKEVAAISAKIQRFVADHDVSGGVTLVACKGELFHLSAVGERNIDKKQPMKTDSIFAIASMIKPITAAALMILQDDGLLSIDDPVAKYLPEEFKSLTLVDGQKPKRAVTLRDLMSHTSGVIGSRKNEGTLEETVKKLSAKPLDFQPGEGWSYSPGLTVCGRIVEVVAKMPFDQFLARRIFTPLNMRDTTFYPNAAQQKRLVQLCQQAEDGDSLVAATHWINNLEGRTTNPSGGLFSTASDLLRFYQMVLDGGVLDGRRILSKSAVEDMTRLQTGELPIFGSNDIGWGLGCAIVRQPRGGFQSLSSGTYGHSGAFGTPSGLKTGVRPPYAPSTIVSLRISSPVLALKTRR